MFVDTVVVCDAIKSQCVLAGLVERSLPLTVALPDTNLLLCSLSQLCVPLTSCDALLPVFTVPHVSQLPFPILCDNDTVQHQTHCYVHRPTSAPVILAYIKLVLCSQLCVPFPVSCINPVMCSLSHLCVSHSRRNCPTSALLCSLSHCECPIPCDTGLHQPSAVFTGPPVCVPLTVILSYIYSVLCSLSQVCVSHSL